MIFPMHKEYWIPVIGGNYAVSNFGNLRRQTKGRKTYPGKVLKTQKIPNGYLVYNATIPQARTKMFYIHRLVFSAFNGLIPKDREINHLDGDKLNNKIDNLELVTRKENCKHALDSGLVRGIKYSEVQDKMHDLANKNTKITATELASIFKVSHKFVVASFPKNYFSNLNDEQLIITMREMRSQGYKIREIAKILNLGNGYVASVCNGKFRKCVGGPIIESKRKHIPKETKNLIGNQIAQGRTLKSVAEEFDVSISSVSRIKGKINAS